MKSFADFDLLPSLQKTLQEKRLLQPTEIQIKAIPVIMAGRSVVGVSETGSGKTLAYALPMLNLLKTLENDGDPITEENSPRAVVIVPTRELGEQVARVFKIYTHETRLRVRAVLGGTALQVAKRNTEGKFDILVATPGRIVQLLKADHMDLSDVRTLIFDEADQMLDEGFLPNADEIVESCPPGCQLALFSATVSPTVQELMSKLFTKAEVIRSTGSGKTVPTLMTRNKAVLDGKRLPLLQEVLDEPVKGGTLIFTNTREQCDKVAAELIKLGHKCAIYRGEMDKQERKANLKKFREGAISLLVSTDLASRGLDLEHVGRVINYHLPQQMENYIHRVGRTARAGRKGMVINFVTERDAALIGKMGTIGQSSNVSANTSKRSASSPNTLKRSAAPAHSPKHVVHDRKSPISHTPPSKQKAALAKQKRISSPKRAR